MSGELRALKEAEEAAKNHDQDKTKHYAKLGSTFAIRGNALQSKSVLGVRGRNRGAEM